MKRREFLAAMAAGTLFASLPGRLAHAATESQLAELDMVETTAMIERGELTQKDATFAAMRRIDKLNPQLNAFVTKSYKPAVQKLAEGKSGRLAGVPYALKDLNWQEGVRFTSGSHFFANNTGEAVTPYTEKIMDTGVTLLGQTNTPEFGLLPSTESALLGPAHNPWNPEYSTAGSSGGAGAAVAARLLPAAQASDGGGSIRLPAAANGVFGLKPTRGRFPFQGTPMSGWDISIRHAVSITVRDNALLLALTENDDRVGKLPPVGFVDRPLRKNKHLRIAVSVRSGDVEAEADIRRAVKRLADRLDDEGHRVDELRTSPLDMPDFFDDFIVLWAVNAANIVETVERATRQRAEDTGLLEPWTIGLARFSARQPSDRLDTAKRNFERLSDNVDKFLNKYDVWLTPSTGTPTPKLGYFNPFVPFDTLLERVTPYAAFTPIHNVAGTPAMSVPAGFHSNGLPIGAQFAARQGQEELLLQLAYLLEDMMPWRKKKPPISA